MKINKINEFYLDLEKDIVVELYKKGDKVFYALRTPNHNTGNLISNLTKLCDLDTSFDENNLKIIKGEVPAYINGNNELIYIFRLGNTKVANIYSDGHVELKASIPAISKTLMSQTKNYTLPIEKTIIKTYIYNDIKFRSDLHVHMNGVLSPDNLIALGIVHQIAYPLYYIKKLKLKVSNKQKNYLLVQREKTIKRLKIVDLDNKYYVRMVDDNTFINFASLILENIENAFENIKKIRNSLAVLKDGQAVFTNLEKTYLYRYVFTKGKETTKKIKLKNIHKIPDKDIENYCLKMIEDDQNPRYSDFNIFEDKLLWIARAYKKAGIEYIEISDTTLVKKNETINLLKQIHRVMPLIHEETKVKIRFLAAIRRIPLTLVKDKIVDSEYLRDNVATLKVIYKDPYVAGSDIVGEELNDIRELQYLFKELLKIASKENSFIIRIHAGENNGLKDNVLNSIKMIKSLLNPGQKMPQIRIGHGLHTPSLKSKKGKLMLKELKENNITLEFQLTSNVRLNNLNNLDNHPLKKYLNEGINCVEGSDGAALYGTNPIDEQLSLEKLLNLNYTDELKMKETETKIIKEGLRSFDKKNRSYHFDPIKMQEEIEYEIKNIKEIPIVKRNSLVSKNILGHYIKELPLDKTPIVVVGGSFNIYQRKSVTTKEALTNIDSLLKLDPKKYFFVLGHKVSAYEKHLVENNNNRFKIYAFVPTLISKNDAYKLINSQINIRISTESSAIATYKSFNYEIFERRNSFVVAFDGDGSAENLIQEAKNGKGKAKILISKYAISLKNKAESLLGYVTMFSEKDNLKKIIENADFK